MCYLDRTFCNSPECQNKCGVQWTVEHQRAANKWMKDPPVAFSAFCGGDCYSQESTDYINRIEEAANAPRIQPNK